MSDDWQAGDVALCISNPGKGDGVTVAVPHPGVRSGRFFTVDQVVHWMGALGLVLRGYPTSDKPFAHDARGFRRIPPHKADEFDREVIEHMLGKPVREPSA